MNLKCKGAVGPDDILLTLFKTLGKKGKAELLSIIYESFSNGVSNVKETTVLPLKIAGKSKLVISSYGPVSLTYYVVKTMERMVRKRLYNLVETSVWLCGE